MKWNAKTYIRSAVEIFYQQQNLEPNLEFGNFPVGISSKEAVTRNRFDFLSFW